MSLRLQRYLNISKATVHGQCLSTAGRELNQSQCFIYKAFPPLTHARSFSMYTWLQGTSGCTGSLEEVRFKYSAKTRVTFKEEAEDTEDFYDVPWVLELSRKHYKNFSCEVINNLHIVKSSGHLTWPLRTIWHRISRRHSSGLPPIVLAITQSPSLTPIH